MKRVFFRTPEVFDHVLGNVNDIIAKRPDAKICEIVVFTPPGDGGMNSPIGKTKDEIDYGWQTNLKYTRNLSVADGRVDAEGLADIFYNMGPEEAMGISSRRTAPGTVIDDSIGYCSPSMHTSMIDFRCDEPEEAIHTMERMGVDIRGSDVVLLDSGISFHAHIPGVVNKEIDAESYLDTLEHVDSVCQKWVPLQRKQGYQLLRVSPSLQKPRIPVALDI